MDWLDWFWHIVVRYPGGGCNNQPCRPTHIHSLQPGSSAIIMRYITSLSRHKFTHSFVLHALTRPPSLVRPSQSLFWCILLHYRHQTQMQRSVHADNMDELKEDGWMLHCHRILLYMFMCTPRSPSPHHSHILFLYSPFSLLKHAEQPLTLCMTPSSAEETPHAFVQQPTASHHPLIRFASVCTGATTIKTSSKWRNWCNFA